MAQPISTDDLGVMLRQAGVDYDVVVSDDVTIDGSQFLVKGRPRKGAVVLLQFPDQDVGHFVCVWRRGGKWMYYDPTGKAMGHHRVLPPLDGVDWSPYVHQKRYLKEIDGAQSKVMDMNTCGRHCVERLRNAKLTHAAYDKWLGRQPFKTPDEFVNART